MKGSKSSAKLFMSLLLVSFLVFIIRNTCLAELDLRSIVRSYQEEYSRSFSSKMEMRRVKPGKDDRVSVFAAWIKGEDYSLIRFLAPVREKGTAFLKNKDQMYFYLPNVAKTIRISGRQRILDSDFSGADILGMDLAADYTFDLEGSERIDGIDHYILVLKAKSRTATYDKVRLWLRKSDQLPRKEEFYTSSGKLLQILTYDDFDSIGGQLRPKKMTMRSTMSEGQYTVITILEANYDQAIPDEMFSLFNLKRGM